MQYDQNAANTSRLSAVMIQGYSTRPFSDEEKVRLFVDFLVERFKERGWGGRAYDRPAEIAGREPEGGLARQRR